MPRSPEESGRKHEGRAKDNPLTKLEGQHHLDWTKGSREGVGRTRRNWRSRALGGDKRGVRLYEDYINLVSRLENSLVSSVTIHEKFKFYLIESFKIPALFREQSALALHGYEPAFHLELLRKSRKNW